MIQQRLLHAAVLALSFATPAAAAPGVGASKQLDALINGKAPIGKQLLRLNALRCADTGGAGLVCKTEHRGRILTVAAKRLGPRTPSAIARRFEMECGGLVGFDNSSCTFGVRVRPASIAQGSVDAGQGKRPLVTLNADSFDLF